MQRSVLSYVTSDGRIYIQSGDVLCFSGHSTSSFFVKWITWSAYSHVGVAVWGFDLRKFLGEDKFPGVSDQELYVVQSSSEPTHCVIHNYTRVGVSVVSLNTLLQRYQQPPYYSTRICWTRFMTGPGVNRDAYIALLVDFIRRHCGGDYSYNAMSSSAIADGCDQPSTPAFAHLDAHAQHFTAYNCSQLAVAIYRHMYVLRLSSIMAVSPALFSGPPLPATDYMNEHAAAFEAIRQVVMVQDAPPSALVEV